MTGDDPVAASGLAAPTSCCTAGGGVERGACGDGRHGGTADVAFDQKGWRHGGTTMGPFGWQNGNTTTGCDVAACGAAAWAGLRGGVTGRADSVI